MADESETIQELAEEITALTQRIREVEEAEAKTREYYGSLLDDVPLLICRYLPDFRIAYANKPYCDYFDRRLDELVGTSFLSLIPEEDHATVRNNISLLGAEHPVHTYQHRVVLTDGTFAWHQWTDHALFDERGKIVAYQSIGEDITERKHLEERDRLAGKEWERTFNAVPDLVCIIDREYKIRRMNTAMAKRLGTTPAEAVGLTCYMGVHAAESPPDFCPHRLLLQDHQEHSVEVSEERLGGDFLVTCTPLWGKDGQLLGGIHIARDISERKRAEKLLALLADMVDLAPSAITVHDFGGNFLYSNRKNLEIHGYALEELMALNLRDIDAPASAELIEERMDLIRTRGEASFEVEHYRKDGSVLPLEVSVTLVDWNGSPALLSIGTDITDRKRAEGALRESEERYRSLTEAMNDILWTTDLEFNITYVSPSVEKVLGFSVEERMRQPLEETMPPENLQMAADAMAEELASDGERDPERHIILDLDYFHKDGSVRCLETTLSFIRDDSGEPVGIHGLSRDITERKRAEEALRESEERYRAIFDSLQESYHEVDLDGNYYSFNRAALEISGYSAEEFSRMNFRTLVDKENRKKTVKHYQQVLRSGEPIKAMETEILKKDGGKVPLEVSVSLKRDADGDPVGFSVVARDITERKRAEEALRANSERATRQRNAIATMALDAAVVAGDMRTALHRVTGVLSEAMEVERASVWFLSDDGSELQCQSLYEAGPARHAEGDTLSAATFPDYFASLRERSRIAVEHAPSDPRTGNLAEHYLVPLGIGSLLDAGIFIEGNLVGVVSLEHVGNPRTWHADEESFASAAAALVAQIIVNNQRQRIQEELESKYALLAIAGRTTKFGGWRVDLATNIITWSDEVADIHEMPRGHSPKVSEGIRFYAPEWQEKITQVFGNCAEKGIPYDEEMEIITGKGNRVWVRTVGEAVRDAEGTIVAVQGSFQDITARKRAEERLRLQALVLDQISDRVTVTDLNGTITYVNEAEAQSMGCSREELIGSSTEVFGDDSEEGATQREILEETLRRGRWRGEVINRGIGGREYVMDCRTQVVHDEAGQPIALCGVSTDITEGKQFEEALRESEEKHRRLFETMAQGVIYQAADGTIISANPATERILGLSFDQMRGKTSMDPRWKMIKEDGTAVPGEDHPAMIALRTGETVGPVVRGVFHPDKNDHIWLSITAIPLFQPGETEPFQAYATFEDITERKNAEDALLESEQRFQKVLDAVPDMVSIHSPDMDILYSNWQGFAAVPVEKRLSNTKCYTTYRGLDAICPDCRAKNVLETREPMHEEVLLPDGRWFELRVIPLLDTKNDVEMFVEWVSDITERKQIDDALRESERFLQNVFDAIQDGISVLDRNFNVLRVNRWYEERYAHSIPLTGRRCYDVYQQRDSVCPFCPAARTYETGESHTAIVPYPSAESPEGWLELSSFPLWDKDGTLTGSIEYAKDITKRKQAEEEIRRLNEELEQKIQERTAQLALSNQELESFSYSVSHDLRAPLRGIDGWSLALLEDYGERLDEQARTYLSRIRKETQLMGTLIDDLLRLSRVSRGELHATEIDLSAMAQDITHRIQSEHPEASIELTIQPGLKTIGDSRLFDIALFNLFDNAFKFTGSRSPARIEFGETEIEGERVFFIRDNGVGFDMAYVQKLFDPFQRFHRSSEYPGTGIGLTTVQRIVHRHGGRIWAYSEPDQGTTLFFTVEEVP